MINPGMTRDRCLPGIVRLAARPIDWFLPSGRRVLHGDPSMSDTNAELDRIMRDLALDCSDVARELNVPLDRVMAWTSTDTKRRSPMPESELQLLRFSVMSENRSYFLF